MARKKKNDNHQQAMDAESIFLAAYHLINAGVTPDHYVLMYNALVHGDINTLMNYMDQNDDDVVPADNTARLKSPIKKQSDKKSGVRSLRLKIQMKYVTKPPMWREVLVPADMSFLGLHNVIQTVCGFDGYHLWRFQEKIYNSYPEIGLPSDDDPDVEDASQINVTDYLAQKGDTMEYVYDFGDDWIFTITVLEASDMEVKHPSLLKWKSDLQPAEDSGGPYAYMEMRGEGRMYDDDEDDGFHFMACPIDPNSINSILSKQ